MSSNRFNSLITLSLSNMLLTILFVLVFDVLNFGVVINNILNLLLFALIFTVIDLVFYIQVQKTKSKILLNPASTKMLVEGKTSILYFLLGFVILSDIISIGFLFISSLLFQNTIIFERKYIVLIIGLLVVIFRFILYLISNLFIKKEIPTQEEIDEEMKKRFYNLFDNFEIEDTKITEEHENLEKKFDELEDSNSEEKEEK